MYTQNKQAMTLIDLPRLPADDFVVDKGSKRHVLLLESWWRSDCGLQVISKLSLSKTHVYQLQDQFRYKFNCFCYCCGNGFYRVK